MMKVVEKCLLTNIISSVENICFNGICTDLITHFSNMYENKFEQINILYDKIDDGDCNIELGLQTLIESCKYKGCIDIEEYSNKYLNIAINRIAKITDKDPSNQTIQYIKNRITVCLYKGIDYCELLLNEVYNSLLDEFGKRVTYLKTGIYPRNDGRNELIEALGWNGYNCISNIGNFYLFENKNGTNLYIYSRHYFSNDFLVYVKEFLAIA